MGMPNVSYTTDRVWAKELGSAQPVMSGDMVSFEATFDIQVE